MLKRGQLTIITLLVVFCGVDPPAGRTQTVRMASWNLLSAGTPGSAEYLAADSILERICGEIVGVQEINNSPDTENFESLAADAGYPYHAYGDTSGTLSGGLRNGVMSTLEILSTESWGAAELSGDPQANDITRDIFSARLAVDATRRVGVIVVHLKAMTGETNRFRRQVEIIRVCQAADIYRTTYPGDPLVILGDINENINDGPFGSESWYSLPSNLPATYELGSDITFPITYDPFVTLENAGFIPCFATWEDDTANDTTYLPDSRLDYIFYDSGDGILTGDEVYYSMEDNGIDDPPSGNWLAKCGTIPDTGASSNASDHLLVMADFLFDTGTPTVTPTPTPIPSNTPTQPPQTPTATPSADYTPIATIQYTTDPSGDSPLAGTIVTTCGIVTAAETSHSLICIQDGAGAWNGIALYDVPVALTVGDAVLVTGTVQEYYGMTEIISMTSVDILGAGAATPVPESMETGSVSAEAWESVLIEVTGLTITDDNLGYGEWEVDDGSGPLVVGDYYTYSYVPFTGGTLYYLRGPVFYSFDAFKVEPRNDTDIGVSPVPPTSTPLPPTATPVPTSTPLPTDTPTPPPTDTPTPLPSATPTSTPTMAPTSTPTAEPTSTPVSTTTPTAECVNHGDVNGDGHLSSSDAQLAFYFVLQMQTPTYEEACAADCNGNGSLSAGDSQLIFYAVLGSGNCVDPIP